MTGYYDGWCEAKRRLESTPDDEFLLNLVDNLRGLALHEYVEQELLKYDLDERLAPGDVTAEEVGQFLAGLDELRAPSKVELNDIKAQLMADALKALRKMRGLNWTGDHTYGDALDDAEKVLDKVWRGEPFPNLERFRCPSLYGSRARQDEQVRCDLQLPHDSDHKAYAPAGMGTTTWTDEQSVNPPKPYYEPCGNKVFGYTCILSWGHSGSHQGEHGKTWSGVPARCTSRAAGVACVLLRDHTGRHSSGGDEPLTWPGP